MSNTRLSENTSSTPKRTKIVGLLRLPDESDDVDDVGEIVVRNANVAPISTTPIRNPYSKNVAFPQSNSTTMTLTVMAPQRNPTTSTVTPEKGKEGVGQLKKDGESDDSIGEGFLSDESYVLASMLNGTKWDCFPHPMRDMVHPEPWMVHPEPRISYV